MAWQRDSGCNEGARIEGRFARWKQVIGDGLRFNSDQIRATEVAVTPQVLNRILDLGSSNCVPPRLSTVGNGDYCASSPSAQDAIRRG